MPRSATRHVTRAVILGVTLGLASFGTPARAQTYDPAYPFCLHVFGDLEGERMDCIFTAWDQCAASASGRPATCVANPYYVAKKRAPARLRREQ